MGPPVRRSQAQTPGHCYAALQPSCLVETHLPGDKASLHGAVVAHEDQPGQEVFERGGAAGAHGQERRGVEVEHEEVGRLAGLEAAGLAVERERARAAERGQIPEMERAQRHVLDLLHLVRVGHGVEERRRRAGADVAAEADDHAGVQHAMQRKEAAAEEEVRVRAVGDARAAARQQIELFRGEPDAVREHRALAEQAVAVVHVRVLGLREELLHPAHFVAVLGDVRVHPGVGELLLELPRELRAARASTSARTAA